MARQLTDRTQTDSYIEQVKNDAGHHAEGMIHPALNIYELMIALIDFSKDKVEVIERNGEIKRSVWVTVKGIKIYFTYSYDRKVIVMRKRSNRGNELAEFLWNEKKPETDYKLKEALRGIGVQC